MYTLPFGDPNPRTRRACHSSTLVAEEMRSGDTSVTASPLPRAALSRGSKKPLQLLLETSHAPKANPPPWALQQGWAGSWCGQGELLPAVVGKSQVPGVGKDWQPMVTACPGCRPRTRPPETPTSGQQSELACPAPHFPTEGRAPAQ